MPVPKLVEELVKVGSVSLTEIDPVPLGRAVVFQSPQPVKFAEPVTVQLTFWNQLPLVEVQQDEVPVGELLLQLDVIVLFSEVVDDEEVEVNSPSAVELALSVDVAVELSDAEPVVLLVVDVSLAEVVLDAGCPSQVLMKEAVSLVDAPVELADVAEPVPLLVVLFWNGGLEVFSGLAMVEPFESVLMLLQQVVSVPVTKILLVMVVVAKIEVET